jgi:tRNA(Leu) C34 or U34 (ribose-2'-O)-methylase TrmL
VRDDRDEDGLFIWRRGQEVHRARDGLQPAVPAVVLIDPKYPHNVARAVRTASCYGVGQVWYQGARVSMLAEGGRLPREERMRGYADVALVKSRDPLGEILRACPTAVPVAVEVRAGSEDLRQFWHPHDAVYVFGPEDGSLTGDVLKRCHRFVTIPTRHCLNLADSLATVLYARAASLGLDLSVAGEQRRAR